MFYGVWGYQIETYYDLRVIQLLWELLEPSKILHLWLHGLSIFNSPHPRMLAMEDPAEVPPPQLPDGETEAKTWWMNCLRPYGKILDFWLWDVGLSMSSLRLALLYDVTYSRGTVKSLGWVFSHCILPYILKRIHFLCIQSAVFNKVNTKRFYQTSGFWPCP